MDQKLARARSPRPLAGHESGEAAFPTKPRSSSKRAAILDGATKVFHEAGYERASMDAIAVAAGVSKATIYNHFGSKERLFEAIIQDRCDQLFQPLRMLPDNADEPLAVLTAVGRQYIALLLDPSSLALYRLLVAEATRNPDLGAVSYRAGGQAAVQELAGYLSRQNRKGVLAVPDPALAAEQFFGMLNGHLQVRALLCIEQMPPKRRIEEIITTAVRSFIRGYAPEA